MVMETHVAFRCKKCGEVFFKPRNSAQDIVNFAKSALGLLTCPKCGSKDVHEDKTIRT